MARVILLLGVLSVSLGAAGPPQRDATAAAAFEVASIRPAFAEGADTRAYTEGAPNCGFWKFTPAGNRFYQGSVTLCMLIRMAYDVTDVQIVGLPAWANQKNRSAWYEVEGRAPAGTTLTMAQTRAMLRTLLADRFKLAVRQESRAAPVYALVVDAGGHKLSTSAIECPSPAPRMPMTYPPGTVMSCTPQMSMLQLQIALNRYVDRPVVDRTGLEGLYAFAMKFSGTDPLAGADGLPSLYTALREQLGLRLEPRSDPIDALVIDRVEPPAPN